MPCFYIKKYAGIRHVIAGIGINIDKINAILKTQFDMTYCRYGTNS